MTEIESVSKKERTDYDSGRDLLSGLPVSIIHIILSFVPIRDAIRTSFLSRNWRYTWTSLPYLAFDRGCANHDESVSNREECLNNFITRALSLHKGSIHKFEMSGSFQESWPNMDEWLVFLSRNDIRELILNLGYVYSCRDLKQVHSSVYSCNKLTYLELQYCYVDPPPSTFKGFLFLRSLILVHVDMSSNDVENLVANSPLLERLKLKSCGMENPLTDLRISAPNLKYIYLGGGNYIRIYLCAPLLAEMYVSVNKYYDRIAEYQQKKSSICNYTNLIGGCTKLEKLMGDLFFTKIMSYGIEYCQHSFVFHCLKVIELNDLKFEDAKEMSVVARLVIGAPNLHELKFSSNYFIRIEAGEEEEEEDEDDTYHYNYVQSNYFRRIEAEEAEEEEEEEVEEEEEEEAPLVSYMDFQCAAPDFKWEKLRLITMSGFTGHHSEMEFLKLLLERSPVLERMKLFPVNQLASKKVRSLRDELLGCNPASPNFKLWFQPDSLRD